MCGKAGLQYLMAHLEYAVIQSYLPLEEVEINGISYDSRTIKEGELFVCLTGNKDDGHSYIEEAYLQGAGVLLVEKLVHQGKMLHFPKNVTVLLVKDSREALAYISAAYFGYPAGKLKVIGITGTKGKTTTACLIHGMLNVAGHKAGLIGTIETVIGKNQIPAKNTTPESFTIHEYFAKMVEAGCEYAVMEVSSQGVKYKRTEGIEFFIGVFTNFGEDHIGPGEHASLEEYRYYKSCLFQQCKIGIGNLDDPQCGYMFRRSTCEKYGFTCKDEILQEGFGREDRILRGRNITFCMEEDGPMTTFQAGGNRFRMGMPGMFNVYNTLAALQTLRCAGVDIKELREYLRCAHVKGRMQRIFLKKRIACYIDYAHNALSLQNALTTLKLYGPKRILLVFGCGGNRAVSRRLEMGEVAGQLADFTIITSDNPRFEDPQQIIEDILTGIRKTAGRYQVIVDRGEAVAYAIAGAEPGDVVLIAGKGHETYQEIKGVRCHMDDRELVERAEALEYKEELSKKQNLDEKI